MVAVDEGEPGGTDGVNLSHGANLFRDGRKRYGRSSCTQTSGHDHKKGKKMDDDRTQKDMGDEDGPEVEAQSWRKGTDQLAEEQQRRRRGPAERDDSGPEVEAQRRRR